MIFDIHTESGGVHLVPLDIIYTDGPYTYRTSVEVLYEMLKAAFPKLHCFISCYSGYENAVSVVY